MALNKETGFEHWQDLSFAELDARGDGFWVGDDGDIWQLIGVYFAARSISPTGWAVRAMSLYADNSIVHDFPLERFAGELEFVATLEDAQVLAIDKIATDCCDGPPSNDDDIPF